MELKRISAEKLKIWIDFFKWIIVSIVLFLITTKIDEGFRDREISIKETEHYDTYMDYIINSDKIAERRELAQFLAIVTVSEPIRERWEEYFKITNKIYIEYVKESNQIKDSIKDLAFIDSLSLKEKRKLAELEKRISFLNNQITLSKTESGVTSKKTTIGINISVLNDIECEKLLTKNLWEINHMNTLIENNIISFKSNGDLVEMGTSKDINSENSSWEIFDGTLTIRLNNGYSILTAQIKDQIKDDLIQGDAVTKNSKWRWTMKIKK